MEGDKLLNYTAQQFPDFYPRPPGGGRQNHLTKERTERNFYPRPPGGGRQTSGRARPAGFYFYPRPPGGGRQLKSHKIVNDKFVISIHALRVEGDRSRTSVRRARQSISIHALRVEGDCGGGGLNTLPCRFLSTPSGWRATRSSCRRARESMSFLSTPSGWRATRNGGDAYFSDMTFLSTPSGWRATLPVC